MNEQERFWSGDFGNDYLRRNQVDWTARIPFWADVIGTTGARSVHEVGCNAGWNLSAIRSPYPDVQLSGNDLNESAVAQARSAGLRAFVGREICPSEMIFTSGVLIHVAPEYLAETMRSIVDASYRYVLAIEYEADKEEEIEYRGHTGKLWRRPFGKLYQDMGLNLVKEWDSGPAFDRCTAWLLEK